MPAMDPMSVAQTHRQREAVTGDPYPITPLLLCPTAAVCRALGAIFAILGAASLLNRASACRPAAGSAQLAVRDNHGHRDSDGGCREAVTTA